MPVAVFLFETLGYMATPFAARGWDCYCFDLLNEERKETFPSGGSITYIRADLSEGYWKALILRLRPQFLAAFPPCTDLTVAGNSHWEAKELADPLYRVKAMALIYLSRDLGEAAGCPYFIENPVGAISTEWRKPDATFSPHEYGGWLPDNDRHPDFPQYIPPNDAYSKRTCLWMGGGLCLPEKKPVLCWPGMAPQIALLGGKSDLTKKIRSATPRGFAEAMAHLVVELDCLPFNLSLET